VKLALCYGGRASIPPCSPPGAKGARAIERAALEPQKRGRKADPALAEARRLEQLTRENDRLRRQLAQAHTIIDVQKKVCMLLGQLTDDAPDGRS
jgi:transposase